VYSRATIVHDPGQLRSSRIENANHLSNDLYLVAVKLFTNVAGCRMWNQHDPIA
jgi:hypothetical protein